MLCARRKAFTCFWDFWGAGRHPPHSIPPSFPSTCAHIPKINRVIDHWLKTSSSISDCQPSTPMTATTTTAKYVVSSCLAGLGVISLFTLVVVEATLVPLPFWYSRLHSYANGLFESTLHPPQIKENPPVPTHATSLLRLVSVGGWKKIPHKFGPVGITGPPARSESPCGTVGRHRQLRACEPPGSNGRDYPH